MIRKLSLSTYSSKNNNYISFGTMQRTVYNDSSKKDIKYRNNTFLLRGDINWNQVTNFITKNKTPKTIYCYACSDGSEPYSIAIKLISKLGWEKAEKYFPIIARDIDSHAIRRAKSGFINLSSYDIFYMIRDIRNPISEFFEYPKNTNIMNGHYHFFKVTNKLRDCVNFDKGNILNDVNKLNYSNSVIFFRNVWPYLSKEEQNTLMKNLSDNFKKNSALIVGFYDEHPESADDCLNPMKFLLTDFESKMNKYGLYRTKNKIYQKRDTKNFSIYMKDIFRKIIR